MMRLPFSRALLLIVLALLVTSCATAPIGFPKDYSEAFTNTEDTRLGKNVDEWKANHPGKSGFYPLSGGIEGLGARLALIDRAERSIDAQYFLMKPDSAGRLFSVKLLEAADRGVRVRFLLDDIFTSVNDDALLVMNQHPNIEIRLFNPIGRGGVYYANYLGDFKLANRRMHNKSFTVDNQVSIVGGRNIADEYFELLTETEFKDLDMLAVGAIAADIAVTFDRFWNHALAIPMEAYETGKDLPDLETARANMDKQALEISKSIYQRAVSAPLIQDLLEDRVALYPGDSRAITDDPEKLLNEISSDQKTLVTALAGAIYRAKSEVIVITPYFIPGKKGVEFWRNIAGKGVRVAIITNSLASNNHVPVHAGYARYRHDVIDAGVELYELRVDGSKVPESSNEQAYESVTLHTKAVLIDRRYTFIGSLNLDPRSIDINTEMGLMVDNTDLAGMLSDRVFQAVPSLAYRVTENKKGSLRWTTYIDGEEIVETGEPQAGAWLKFKAFMSRILPESQL